MKKFLLLILVAVLIGAFLFREKLALLFFSPTKTSINNGITTSDVRSTKEGVENIKIVAENLEIPWDLVLLPNNDLLVTERSGKLLRITQSGEKSIIQQIPGVEHVGEGGLLGITLHPDFEKNSWIYLYLTSKDASGLINRVERYQFDGRSLSNKKIILDNIRGAQYHDGGKIEFGPDGYLYITTGDAGDKNSAQDIDSLNGKILRVTDEGKQVVDNPFSNAVYSYGHRNPQGIVWDDENRLWSTEHGPSGLETGHDELNLISKGANYGWPIIRGENEMEGMTAPIIQSGSSDTWAPAGIAYWDNSLFFGGLRGESLYEVTVSGENELEMKIHFREEFGRIRAVKLGRDGFLYITTSNQDGRGTVNDGDDKIIKINPKIFR